MGIDFSHCNAHWAYSGFMRFRGRLALDLGYETPLREMYGDGSYTVMKDEPIWPLIDHSDCEDELTVSEMKQILPQLKQLVDAWDDDFDKPRALELIEGMELAVDDNEPMEFR